VKVVVGVTGGIAAYKAADLVSQLVRRGDEVRVVMTGNATKFVGPLTFEALSGHPVMLDALATGGGAGELSAIEHIAWAKWADLTIVAPLTASTLAKLAVGIADDALTTVWMAIPEGKPCLVCPAMNTAMWEHPVVQRNLRWLGDLGRYTIVPPTSKRLACGDVGMGGLADVADMIAAIDGTGRPPSSADAVSPLGAAAAAR
jgi:phosphopantothenoylcysteine decarboxylase / phosphopantothenate---cysteine ligase